jgi:Tfp pilus assembly protein PilX
MKRLHASTSGARRQRGVSLIFALITLVSLLLASIALVRSVSSGSQVLGNIGFQQEATVSADLATSEATTYIAASTTDLTTSSSATSSGAAGTRSGFYANIQDTLDATGQQLTTATRQLIDWDLDGCGYAASGSYASCNIVPHDVDMSGASYSSTTARYVIFRLCAADGAVGSTTCSSAASQSATEGGSARGSCSVEDDECRRLGSISAGYYRIVVRVVGARGTTSFTETIVQY